MGCRDRREARRDARSGGDAAPEVYRMRAEPVDVGDDHRVETSAATDSMTD